MLPAQLAAADDLERAGHRVVEQLLDLEAIAGAAVGVPAGARMHQQRHRARHLAVPLVPLSVRHARLGLVDLPCMCLRITQSCISNVAKRMCESSGSGNCLQRSWAGEISCLHDEAESLRPCPVLRVVSEILPQAGGGDRRSPCSCGTCQSPGRPSSGSQRPAQSPPGTCCKWWRRRAPLDCADGTAPSCCCAWRGACCQTGSGCPGRATGIAAEAHTDVSLTAPAYASNDTFLCP